MKLFLFDRYISAYRETGFALIAARSREEAEKILADKFYPNRPDITIDSVYCKLWVEIEDFPTEPGLICSDDPFIRPDSTSVSGGSL